MVVKKHAYERFLLIDTQYYSPSKCLLHFFLAFDPELINKPPWNRKTKKEEKIKVLTKNLLGKTSLLGITVTS